MKIYKKFLKWGLLTSFISSSISYFFLEKNLFLGILIGCVLATFDFSLLAYMVGKVIHPKTSNNVKGLFIMFFFFKLILLGLLLYFFIIFIKVNSMGLIIGITINLMVVSSFGIVYNRRGF
jgi:hypothetical protein